MVAGKLTGRSLRLAYHSFGQVAGMEAYQSSLEAVVKGSVSPDTVIDVLRLPRAVVAGKGFASMQAFEVPAILSSIGATVDAGYEAVAIGNGFDPGLWEARELYDVPILGLFETVAFYALRAGWRFGVMCSGTSGVARIEEMAQRYGIAARMVRPAAIGVTVPDVVAAFSDSEAARRIVDSIGTVSKILAARGAEVIVVASGALDVFVATQQVRPSVAPLLPSVTVLVRELEGAALLARAGVPYVSRAGRFSKPPADAIRGIRSKATPIGDD